MSDRVKIIIDQLDITSAESVKATLSQVKELTDLTLEEKIELAGAISEIFFHAHHTGSTLMPRMAVLAEKRLVKFGDDIIPYLFHEILEVDSESLAYFGQTLAKIGSPGLEFILKSWDKHKENDHQLINLIQVISYFTIPEATQAIPQLLSIAQHPNHQVKAITLYTLGRLVQKLKTNFFKQEQREEIFNRAFGCLSNSQVLIRKNAARTIGKMLRKGLLTEEQENKAHKTFLAIAGKDEHHNWDRAFIVRREAEDFLPYFHHTTCRTNKYAQSFKILSKKLLSNNIYHFTIEAPFIARKIEAGQFLIIRPHLLSERIPLSICGWNREQGTIDIIVSAVGKTTTQINHMHVGDTFQDVVGPLGERSFLPEENGTCVVIGGGYGTGAIIPTAKELKAMGNKVIGIVGARNKESLIMTQELADVCDELLITTNDGSLGIQGFVTHALQQVINKEQVIYVLAVGPVPMMKAVSDLTRDLHITTYVSLNAIMVDGTGMCGACRVTVGGETKFACFHGPDFDGHKVDFDNLMKRQKMFAKEEAIAFEHTNH